jgi:hypothetical protein
VHFCGWDGGFKKSERRQTRWSFSFVKGLRFGDGGAFRRTCLLLWDDLERESGSGDWWALLFVSVVCGFPCRSMSARAPVSRWHVSWNYCSQGPWLVDISGK